ncbi:glycosyltransferase [Sporohalobacter salinus]|uniref:glycosyltransferase n=1 Tax=Sporohalobacter salinus TaxID=1494606 RepID=UPI00195FD411|nr:glycosyltransferase [Sporohalobacter salinus]MBM7624079.1 glycosyltransferase involved in cell wall biosynthesis [Sporohalobacter salinus]
MHIAMFTNNYKPFVGGVPISIELFARQFRKLGHKVSIFAPEYYEDVEDEKDTFRVPSLKVIKYGDSCLPIPISGLSDFKKNFVDFNIDIIHCHHPFFLGKVGQKLGDKHNIPVVYTYHTRFKEYCVHLPSGVRQICETVLDKVIKNFCNQADLIFTPTEGMTGHLIDKGIQSKIEVIPTGIVINNYNKYEKEEIEDYRKQLGLKLDEDVLLFVSRLSKEKNIGFLFESLQPLLKSNKGNKTKLLIVGDGPRKEKLMQKTKKLSMDSQVEFLGERSREELIKLYKLADVFVFSSLSETQGIVIIEALAGETPVVALNGTGVRDIITDGKDGYLLEPEDKDGFHKRVLKLLNNEQLLDNMSEKAWQKANQYSINTLAKEVLSYYQNLCNKGPNNYKSELAAGSKR